MAPLSEMTTPKHRSATKNRCSKRPYATTTKKTISSTRKPLEKIPYKLNNTLVVNTLKKTASTTPKAKTPQPKQHSQNNTAAAAPDTVKKPSSKRPPKHAHSGVPVPKKMEALKRDLNDSL